MCMKVYVWNLVILNRVINNNIFVVLRRNKIVFLIYIIKRLIYITESNVIQFII